MAERDLAGAVPLAGLLGIEIVSAEPDEVRGTLPWAPERCTAGGVLHGGALMAREPKPPRAAGSPPSPEPAQSPFADDSDWDSELAAWDAALPIGTTVGSPAPPAPVAAEESAPIAGEQPQRNGHPEELDGTAPPDADSVQFDAAEMEAEHAPAEPLLTVEAEAEAEAEPQALFPLFSQEDVDEKTDVGGGPGPLAAEESDALDIVEEQPVYAQRAPERAEGSGLFVIPDVLCIHLKEWSETYHITQRYGATSHTTTRTFDNSSTSRSQIWRASVSRS